jgi:glycosyltransferase involved in cell wall biosynthesis
VRKRRILVVSDSAHLNTGFGRVAREIGTALVATGQWDVSQLGWFHNPSTAVVPFRVYPTTGQDAYGHKAYPETVARLKPDIVLAIGDDWMIGHMLDHPRTCPVVGYVPIDSEPVSLDAMKTFSKLDHLVLYGMYAWRRVHGEALEGKRSMIPHGVDLQTFRPLPIEEKQRARAEILGGRKGVDFIVGCVARNTTRKNLPALVRTFRMFVNGSTSCQDCGNIFGGTHSTCRACNSGNVVSFAPKDDAWLYMHCVADERQNAIGFDLASLVAQQGLAGRVGMPKGMKVGGGVTDTKLNEIYNAMDVFSLPTMGEGWGLPILEAMAAGTPVLVTDYSAHTQFVAGCGDMISPIAFVTCVANNSNRAVVDELDYLMKLDRLYYSPEQFTAKWARYIAAHGGDSAPVADLPAGPSYRADLSLRSQASAAKYSWASAHEMWNELLTKLTGDIDESPAVAMPLLEV